MPIFDQGYQHWQGRLSGHGWRGLAGARHRGRAPLRRWVVPLMLPGARPPATAVVPAVGAYLLGLAFSLDLAVVRDTHRLLWAGILYGAVVTLSAGTLMLALSSLSRRSIYVGLAWAGLVFLTHMLSSALIGINGDTERRAITSEGLDAWVKENPPPPGV